MPEPDYKPPSTARKRVDRALEQAIGQQVRAARVAAGLSQEALGSLIGVSFQQVQKYENGRNRLSASGLRSLAQALNRPMAFFVGEDVLASPRIVDGKLIDLAAKLRALDPHNLALVKRLLRAMDAETT